MHVLITNLHKYRAAFSQEFSRNCQTITQIGKVRVDVILPGVAERLNLLRLARNVRSLPSFTSRDSVDTCQFELNLMP